MRLVEVSEHGLAVAAGVVAAAYVAVAEGARVVLAAPEQRQQLVDEGLGVHAPRIAAAERVA